jgi:hypothetical protein
MVEGWAVGRSVVIIHVYSNGNGWNIYTDCGSNKVDATLSDAERRAGWTA